jgi:CubicO group peptidase (beta-lactamase class C family)
LFIMENQSREAGRPGFMLKIESFFARCFIALSLFLAAGMAIPAVGNDDAGGQIGLPDRFDKEERDQCRDDTDRWIGFLDREMRELVETNNLPNAAIALVKDGDIVFLEGYGYADIERNVEADPRGSLFRTGSVAKIFTWTAVMQLVEQGLIDLDSDVNEYLDFALPGRIHGKGRYYQPPPITMNHLLSHTSGFEDVLEGLFLLQEEDFMTLNEYLVTRIPARIFPPGTVMAYSNWGTALAGYIVERVSGIPFGEYIENHIFVPLGMESSTFTQPLPGQLSNRLVGAYRYVDGQFLEGDFEFMPAPAGGLSTTAEDMARFMIAHLTGGGTIMREETVRQMHSLLFTHHTLLGGMAHGFMEYTANGHRVLYHSGSSMLFDAGFYMLPGTGTGIFMVYSGGDFMGHPEIFRSFINEFFPPESRAHLIDDRDAVPGTFPSAPVALSNSELGGEYQQSRRIETGGDKLVNLLSMVMRVRPEGERSLIVSLLGSEYRFVEIEEGIYSNLDGPAAYPLGPMQHIVVNTDPFGRLMLVTDGQVTYIRMPFYATAGFAAVVVLFAVLMALATLVYFAGKGIAGFFRRKDGKGIPVEAAAGPASLKDHGDKAGTLNGEMWARRLVLLHAVLFLLMLVSMANAGRPDPVYLLPLSAIGYKSVFTSLMSVLPAVITLLSIPILVYCIVVWRKGLWKLAARIHYSFYTFTALLISWFFWFYNSAGF